MTWTYDADMSIQRDRVRLIYADTDAAEQLLQDGELALVLTGGQMAQSSELGMALAAARIVLAKYAHSSVDVSAGGASVKLSQRVANLKDAVIPMLETMIASASSAAPYLGGISRSDVAAREADADRVPPFFTRATGEASGASGWR